MRYSQNLTDVRADLESYAPPADLQDKYFEALVAASPVVRIVAIFDMLKPIEPDLDDDGRRVLCGCAHMIAHSGWSNKGGEAIEVLQTAASKLPEIEIQEIEDELINPLDEIEAGENESADETPI